MLNKSVCKRCINTTEFHGEIVKWNETKDSNTDDEHWKDGMIWCPHCDDPIYFEDAIEICSYKLEHIVLEQNNV